jgi:hypothetical protein
VRTSSQQSRVIRLLVIVSPPASSLALLPLPPYPDLDFSRESRFGAMNACLVKRRSAGFNRETARLLAAVQTAR